MKGRIVMELNLDEAASVYTGLQAFKASVTAQLDAALKLGHTEFAAELRRQIAELDNMMNGIRDPNGGGYKSESFEIGPELLGTIARRASLFEKFMKDVKARGMVTEGGKFDPELEGTTTNPDMPSNVTPLFGDKDD